MAISVLNWNIVDAFDKFGFGVGAEVHHTHEVVDAIEESGPYICTTQQLGLHNEIITSISMYEENEIGVRTVVRTWEFDGYTLPRWADLTDQLRYALTKLNGGLFDWRIV